MIKSQTLDITPDKSLIKKIGMVGYRTEQAVAELIDNSIDAMDGGTAHIDVELRFKERVITVSDDCNGMNVEGLRGALVVARGGRGGRSLGSFGMGMKSACSALGRRFSITTARRGSAMEHTALYDESEWLSGGSDAWDIKVRSARKAVRWGGTVIRIERLNVPIYPNQATSFKKSFGIRYGPHLKSGRVVLRINSHECAPAEPEIDGPKSNIGISLAGGNRITGWIGLLKKRSVKGDYGMHLYRNGRLIRAFDKFGIRRHPEVAKVIGELHLDHVPVNFHKTGFMSDSAEYAEAVDAFRGDPVVARVLKRIEGAGADQAGIGKVLGGSDVDIVTRVSAANAERMLRGAERFKVEGLPEAAEMEFVSGGPDLYSMSKKKGAYTIRVNRDSPLFRTAKNPLSLIGMIKIEAGLVMKDPERLGAFLESRNEAWRALAGGAGSPKGGAAGARPPRRLHGGHVAPGYSLAGELVRIHDLLAERFPHRFQFTGLSTLYPFLHNAYNVMVYSLHAEKGTGEELLSVASDCREDFTLLHEPDRSEMSTAARMSRPKPVIVIREYAEQPSGTWAEPAKAWLDLYHEVERRGTSIYADDLSPMLARLAEAGLVARERLESLASRRRALAGLRPHMIEAGW